MGDIDLIELACLLLTHYHTCLPRALSETAMTRQALRLALKGRGGGGRGLGASTYGVATCWHLAEE